MPRAINRVTGVLLGFTLPVCLYAPPALAQPSSADDDPAPLARFAPASATCFFTATNPDALDRALRRRHIHVLWSLLEGRTSEPNRTFDLRESLVKFIGEQRSIPIDELMERELAAVAPSWSRLDQAFWLVRVADEELIDRWFPPADRAQEDDTGQMRFFSVAGDIIVCVRDDVLAMGRRSVKNPFLGETMARMANLKGSTLDSLPAFSTLTASLPPRSLGMLYVTPNTAEKRSVQPLSFLTTDHDHVVVGFYREAYRLDLALRTLPPRAARPAVSDYAVEQLLKLPRATLLAWARAYLATPPAPTSFPVHSTPSPMRPR